MVDTHFALVTELADGCVLSLLRLEEIQIPTLLEFVLCASSNTCKLNLPRDVASAMAFLADHNIVHRDLSARNLLYFSTSRGYQIKVTLHQKVFLSNC